MPRRPQLTGLKRYMAKGTQRYTPKRKFAIIMEIEEKKKTREEVMQEHGLTEYELECWYEGAITLGLLGLKTTFIQERARVSE